MRSQQKSTKQNFKIQNASDILESTSLKKYAKRNDRKKTEKIFDKQFLIIV